MIPLDRQCTTRSLKSQSRGGPIQRRKRGRDLFLLLAAMAVRLEVKDACRVATVKIAASSGVARGCLQRSVVNLEGCWHIKIDKAMPHRKTAVTFYRTSAVEYLLGDGRLAKGVCSDTIVETTACPAQKSTNRNA